MPRKRRRTARTKKRKTAKTTRRKTKRRRKTRNQEKPLGRTTTTARATNGKLQMAIALLRLRPSRSHLTITITILPWMLVLFRLIILNNSLKVQDNQRKDGGMIQKRIDAPMSL